MQIVAWIGGGTKTWGRG